MENYLRYHIDTKKAANIVPHPHRFNVKVKRLALAKLLIKELFHYRGNAKVILSRPCVYGVFSGPLGGFLPREHLCVGCLRCTVQYPDMAQIAYNPARQYLGDAYFRPEYVDAVVSEAETGRIPIKGAGYRGRFGGTGWDGMWTDMSEIVRPTRDGIHGREYISTEVDVGSKPPCLTFDEERKLSGPLPKTITIPIPLLFDILPQNNGGGTIARIVEKAARQLKTFAILPLPQITGEGAIPLVYPQDLPQLKRLSHPPLLLEMGAWDPDFYKEIQTLFPNTLLILRTNFDNPRILSYYQAGIRILHLTADLHGKSESGQFVLDMIRQVHNTFVEAKCRNEITLIGSGGMIVAEHIPKAILCGLDAVALDTPILVALQAQFNEGSFKLPNNITIEWGVQRLKNLFGAWRDQLLEILGAMGMREVRRLRGETGRVLFQKELEMVAFNGISGYESD